MVVDVGHQVESFDDKTAALANNRHVVETSAQLVPPAAPSVTV